MDDLLKNAILAKIYTEYITEKVERNGKEFGKSKKRDNIPLKELNIYNVYDDEGQLLPNIGLQNGVEYKENEILPNASNYEAVFNFDIIKKLISEFEKYKHFIEAIDTSNIDDKIKTKGDFYNYFVKIFLKKEVNGNGYEIFLVDTNEALSSFLIEKVLKYILWSIKDGMKNIYIVDVENICYDDQCGALLDKIPENTFILLVYKNRNYEETPEGEMLYKAFHRAVTYMESKRIAKKWRYLKLHVKSFLFKQSNIRHQYYNTDDLFMVYLSNMLKMFAANYPIPYFEANGRDIVRNINTTNNINADESKTFNALSNVKILSNDTKLVADDNDPKKVLPFQVVIEFGGKQYYDVILDENILKNIPRDNLTKITIEEYQKINVVHNRGEVTYNKYLKYKSKYLQLKKLINN
jgi:hypothetical protein